MKLPHILLLLMMLLPSQCVQAEEPSRALKLLPAVSIGLPNRLDGDSARLPVPSTKALKLLPTAAIGFKFRYEGDASLLEMLQRWALIAKYDYTFNGIKDLPIVPELREV